MHSIVGVVCIVVVCMLVYFVVSAYVFVEMLAVVIYNHELLLLNMPESAYWTGMLRDLRFCLPQTRYLPGYNLQQHDLIGCMDIVVLFVFECLVHLCFYSCLVSVQVFV